MTSYTVHYTPCFRVSIYLEIIVCIMYAGITARNISSKTGGESYSWARVLFLPTLTSD